MQWDPGTARPWRAGRSSVLLDLRDPSLVIEAVVGDAPGAEAGTASPGAGIDRELAGPAHAGDHGGAAGEVVAHLIRLPGEQLAARRDTGPECGRVTLAAGRADEVGSLDEAHVGREQLGKLVVGRPAAIEAGQETLDVLDVAAVGCGEVAHRAQVVRPNQRARRSEPNRSFRIRSVSDGSWNVPSARAPRGSRRRRGRCGRRRTRCSRSPCPRGGRRRPCRGSRRSAWPPAPRGALGEHTRLRRPLRRDVADGVDAGHARSPASRSRPGSSRPPSSPLATTTSGARCFGTPRKRSNASSSPLSKTTRRGRGRAPRTFVLGTKLDAALGERRDQRRRGVGRRRHRRHERQHEGDLALVAEPAAHEAVVQHQRALARRRRALERCAADADRRPIPT